MRIAIAVLFALAACTPHHTKSTLISGGLVTTMIGGLIQVTAGAGCKDPSDPCPDKDSHAGLAIAVVGAGLIALGAAIDEPAEPTTQPSYFAAPAPPPSRASLAADAIAPLGQPGAIIAAGLRLYDALRPPDPVEIQPPIVQTPPPPVEPPPPPPRQRVRFE